MKFKKIKSNSPKGFIYRIQGTTFLRYYAGDKFQAYYLTLPNEVVTDINREIAVELPKCQAIELGHYEKDGKVYETTSLKVNLYDLKETFSEKEMTWRIADCAIRFSQITVAGKTLISKTLLQAIEGKKEVINYLIATEDFDAIEADTYPNEDEAVSAPAAPAPEEDPFAAIYKMAEEAKQPTSIDDIRRGVAKSFNKTSISHDDSELPF